MTTPKKYPDTPLNVVNTGSHVNNLRNKNSTIFCTVSETGKKKNVLFNFRKFSREIQVFWDIMMVHCVKLDPTFR